MKFTDLLNKRTHKEIILHVGFHRCGSSSTQYSYLKNKKTLQKLGIHYPIFRLDHKSIHNHSIPIYSLYCENPESYQPQFRGNTPVERANAGYQRQLNRALRSYGDRLLLSGEGISLLPPDRLRCLKQHLEQHARRVRVIAVVRHPLDSLESAVQASVGLGNPISFRHLIGQTRSKIVNLTSVFGKEVEFLDFQAAARCEFGPAGFLLAHLGVERAHLDHMTFYRRNTGMSGEAVRLISYLCEQSDRDGRHTAASNMQPVDSSSLKVLPGGKFKLYNSEFESIVGALNDEVGWLNDNLGFGFEVSESMREDFAEEWAAHTLETLAKFLSNTKSQRSHELITRYLREEADRLETIDRSKSLRLREFADACTAQD